MTYAFEVLALALIVWGVIKLLTFPAGGGSASGGNNQPSTVNSMPQKSLKETDAQITDLKQVIAETLKKLDAFPEEEKNKRLALMKQILDAYNKQLGQLKRSVEKVVQKKSALKDATQIDALRNKIKEM